MYEVCVTTAVLHRHLLSSAYLDKFQLEVLGHRMRLADTEDYANYVFRSIAKTPQVRHDAIGTIKITTDTRLKHIFNKQRMWFITYLKQHPTSDQ